MLRYVLSNVNQKCFITEAFLLAKYEIFKIQGYPCFLRALKGTVSYISNNFERPLEEWRWRLLKEFKLFALYFFMYSLLLVCYHYHRHHLRQHRRRRRRHLRHLHRLHVAHHLHGHLK
ncbi:hypothetical protein T4D_14354 [Trichinella pseudospiralis]|uniref:Uncharacterized protein n=1 Tax=Trichinella pseudospiralis TaxID=6337 RepID=A0A0V1FYH6_TRIPS|nr:hypothetical protein T4D_14354 [Trichinella pseudospiralis]